MLNRVWTLGLATTLIFGAIGCEGSFDDNEDGRDDVVELDGELSSIQRAWGTGVFQGNLGVRASWSGGADLDIFLQTPSGEVYSYKNKQGSSGGRFSKNACQASGCRSQVSEEVSWLGEAPHGEYAVWVERYDSKAVDDLVIEISREGAIEHSFAPELAGAKGSKSAVESFVVRELPVESSYNGELALQVSWDGSADLDILVLNPQGEQIYYGRREDSFGGRMTKGECLLNTCKHASSEEVRWESNAPMGNYEVRITNYNGGSASNVKLRVHKHRKILQDLDITVPTRRSASVGPFEVEYQTVPLTPNGVKLDSHSDDQWIKGTSHTFSGSVNAAGIVHTELVVNGRSVGQSSDASFGIAHSFGQLGQQSIEVLGYSADGMLMALERKTIVVTDAQGGLPSRGRGARDVSRSLLAKRLLQLDGVHLYDLLPSGRMEAKPADSLSNIEDAVFGTSRTSCYENANCTDVYISETVLQAMIMINQRHGLKYNVTTITGGSHSRSSRHYSGVAFDVNHINGRKISTSTRTLNNQFTSLCRSFGATEVLAPPAAGHSGHIHCAWPRP